MSAIFMYCSPCRYPQVEASTASQAMGTVRRSRVRKLSPSFQFRKVICLNSIASHLPIRAVCTCLRRVHKVPRCHLVPFTLHLLLAWDPQHRVLVSNTWQGPTIHSALILPHTTPFHIFLPFFIFSSLRARSNITSPLYLLGQTFTV